MRTNVQLRKFICFIWHNSLKQNDYCLSWTYVYFQVAYTWTFNELLQNIFRYQNHAAGLSLFSKFKKWKHWEYLRNLLSWSGECTTITNLELNPKKKTIFHISCAIILTKNTTGGLWEREREQPVVMWYNSICCPLVNVQMGSISGLRKGEASQYKKAAFDYPSQITQGESQFFGFYPSFLSRRLMVLFLLMKSASEFMNNNNANRLFFLGFLSYGDQEVWLENVSPLPCQFLSLSFLRDYLCFQEGWGFKRLIILL